jgi:hypothetical protein
MDKIKEFFVVTLTSVYRASSEEGAPFAEKILRFNTSAVPVGHKIKNGTMVGITEYGLVLYITDKHRNPPCKVDIERRGGRTSPIVAIFLNKDEALKCSKKPHLLHWDFSWDKETKEALQAIKENCDFCKIDPEVFLAGG